MQCTHREYYPSERFRSKVSEVGQIQFAFTPYIHVVCGTLHIIIQINVPVPI